MMQFEGIAALSPRYYLLLIFSSFHIFWVIFVHRNRIKYNIKTVANFIEFFLVCLVQISYNFVFFHFETH